MPLQTFRLTGRRRWPFIPANAWKARAGDMAHLDWAHRREAIQAEPQEGLLDEAAELADLIATTPAPDLPSAVVQLRLAYELACGSGDPDTLLSAALGNGIQGVERHGNYKT